MPKTGLSTNSPMTAKYEAKRSIWKVYPSGLDASGGLDCLCSTGVTLTPLNNLRFILVTSGIFMALALSDMAGDTMSWWICCVIGCAVLLSSILMVDIVRAGYDHDGRISEMCEYLSAGYLIISSACRSCLISTVQVLHRCCCCCEISLGSSASSPAEYKLLWTQYGIIDVEDTSQTAAASFDPSIITPLNGD
jgi:hypothetical protein